MRVPARKQHAHFHAVQLRQSPGHLMTPYRQLCSSRIYPLPANAEETAQQARAAAQRAWEAGVKRQRIELLLPLIGATDLDDW